MSVDYLADEVFNQFDNWIYPEPIEDLPNWLKNNWQWFDPSHSNVMLWPNREYQPNMDILIAGCGTNQAAVFAFNNPKAKVVAIDVSKSSLNHHLYLKNKYKLQNLELHQLPIENIAQLNQDFDLIISTGVIHHLKDPVQGLKALASCLRRDGVIGLMLYGRYGRASVEMLQSMFRALQLKQNQESLSIVKAVLASLPQDHPIQKYMRISNDLTCDAGLIDTFLHQRDKSYTVNDCLELVKESGLVFQDWLFKSLYYVEEISNQAFYHHLLAMPLEKQWSLMEQVIADRNACHFFMATHPHRDKESYEINFNSDMIFETIVTFRYRCQLIGNRICSPGSVLDLNYNELKIVMLIDGKSSIQVILDRVMSESLTPIQDKNDVKKMILKLLKMLFYRDFIAFKIPFNVNLKNG